MASLLNNVSGARLAASNSFHSPTFLAFDVFLKCKGNYEQAKTKRKRSKKKFRSIVASVSESYSPVQYLPCQSWLDV